MAAKLCAVITKPSRIASSTVAIGEPMAIAGLWSSWRSPKGDLVYSYTMLTINADDHPLMRLFHKPADEMRMGVLMALNRCSTWWRMPAMGCCDMSGLKSPESDSVDFIRHAMSGSACWYRPRIEPVSLGMPTRG